MKLLAVLILLLPLLAIAAPPQASGEDRTILNSAGFLSGHPDLRWRREGMAAYEDGEFEDALGYFKRAARYADKPSQAMVAEMLWDGTGIEQDRALAYAWMDLAAERVYLPFLAKRESYWSALDATQRQRALKVGQDVYAEYGDAVAQPRLETVLRRTRNNTTGSRVGFVGALQVIVPGPGGLPTSIDGSSYYADKYWEPDQYWEWQADIWRDPAVLRPNVEVRSLEVVEPDSRVPDADY